MFLFRSVFWLAIGFFLVAPHGTDFGATVNGVKDQALAAGVQAGEQFIASQMLAPGVARTLVSSLSSSTPPAVVPMHDPLPAELVFPRPRPAAIG